MAKPQRPNVNSELDTSQNKAVSVSGNSDPANIVGQCQEVNSDPGKISG